MTSGILTCLCGRAVSKIHFPTLILICLWASGRVLTESYFDFFDYSMEQIELIELTRRYPWMIQRLVSTHSRGVLVSVNFGCFSSSRFSHFHCNAMRKAIKAHKNLHTNQQNEHTPVCVRVCVWGGGYSREVQTRKSQIWGVLVLLKF